MARKRLKFSDQLRRAVDASRLSRYRIAKMLGVSESLLSRFMAGKWLGQETLDALTELLDLKIVTGQHFPRGKKAKRSGRERKKGRNNE
jgi:transcriptional regulator with XRE-family HTH domain